MKAAEAIKKALAACSEPVSAAIDRLNLTKRLQRLKKHLLAYPEGPTSPEELEIPEDWQRFANDDWFVFADVQSEGEDGSTDRMILMSSPWILEVA